MELTAEQKYLKALAEWLDIENIPKNRIQEASKEYLDQFTDVSKKVEPEPAWKPEMGKLYKRKINGVITEVVKAFLDNREFSKVAHKIIGMNYDTCHAHCDYASDFIEQYEPVSELEGLDVEDKVWCISSDGETEYYTIESVFSNNVGVYCGKGYISLNLNGSPCMFGNGKQLFYRTEDRAERFGKGGDA